MWQLFRLHYLDSNKETNVNLTCQLLKSNSLDKVIQCDMLPKNYIRKSRSSSYGAVSYREKMSSEEETLIAFITVLMA